MAVLWKYDVVVMSAKNSKDREEHILELGRSGWEIITVLAGDYKTGDPTAPMMTMFMKREATHDINF